MAVRATNTHSIFIHELTLRCVQFDGMLAQVGGQLFYGIRKNIRNVIRLRERHATATSQADG